MKTFLTEEKVIIISHVLISSSISNKIFLMLVLIKSRTKKYSHVDKFKFLGVTVDYKFSFKDHISNVCSEISCSYSMIFKSSHFIPAQTLLKLYHSIVYPFITYVLEVWRKSCKTLIKRVKNVMDKCAKLLSINKSSNKADYLNLSLFQFDEVYKFFDPNRHLKPMNNISYTIPETK